MQRPGVSPSRTEIFSQSGETPMEIQYRTGGKEDCQGIAAMTNIASGGVVEYLFHALVPGMSPVQVLAYNLGNDEYPHTYRSAIVACDGHEMVGMALSYPSSYHGITDDMKGFFPPERLEHFEAFYSARSENTWFLEALCVNESHRRRGIGEELLSRTKEQAVQNGCHALSLIVFADNALAIPVYERAGFMVTQKIELRGNETIGHEGGCLLMACELVNRIS
jgi:ribosomal protein S18 acetylase RimI-like enzyme